MEVIEEGSVRIDLLGGTLDIWPINLVLKEVKTLNLATSLKAKVKVTETDFDGIEIFSKDYATENKWAYSELTYENIYQNNHFGPLNFMIQILDFFDLKKGVRLELESGSPPGAGLGGSSSIGITVFKALCRWTHTDITPDRVIEIVRNIEARILDSGPSGYQDYYPATYGGILCLSSETDGIKVEQLYNKELSQVIEERTTLVYTGQTRLSGINNWEVYKAFFDRKDNVRTGLSVIANLTHYASQMIKDKNYEEFLNLIAEEGHHRQKLFPEIMTQEMKDLVTALKEVDSTVGAKVCGAGGGGCFLIKHSKDKKDEIRDRIGKEGMQVLDFKVEGPLKL